MAFRIDPELVLIMDSCTGEIVIEGDCARSIAKPDSMRKFRTGLVYEDSVASSTTK